MDAKKRLPVVTKRYAQALADLAEEKKVVAKVSEDLQSLQAALDESAELKALTKSPAYSKADSFKALEALAKSMKFAKETTSFIGVLIENRRIAMLPDMIRAFMYEIHKRQGALDVRVRVAKALTQAQEADLQKSLSEQIGKNVSVEIEVDEAVIGGMTLYVGSTCIDHSVAGKLERLGQAMKQVSNQYQENIEKVG